LLASLNKTEQTHVLNQYQNDEQLLHQINFNWGFNARASQFLPEDDWSTWLILAGRGWGKTRTGAETVRLWVNHYSSVNIIGATADDARDIMIEGESGILSVCPNEERPTYKAGKRCLEWPNGAKTLIFTADEPDRLRGKQHSKLWCDELAAWRYPEAWDQAQFGLRLGNNPQAIVTTTPRPTKIVRDLINDSSTFITRGSTYENKDNLAPAFLNTIIKKYEGTRLGRQELLAELLDDNPNALWRRDDIDATRIWTMPELKRIVVGVDPSVTSKAETSAECGIVVAGLGFDDHGFVTDDVSLLGTPDAWARRAVKAFHEHKANLIVAEVNNGGELVKFVIRTIDPKVPYQEVRASRGKAKRAEPIAAMYEQHRIHHVGCFATLEDQMCAFDPSDDNGDSPDRMDALVWALTELMLKPKRDFLIV
jgi:phage terminase large subunit-like protein